MYLHHLFFSEMVHSKMKRFKDHNNLSFWTCIECEYTSKKSSDVFKHVERVHLDLNYFCPICPITFKSKTDLRVHCKKIHQSLPFL